MEQCHFVCNKVENINGEEVQNHSGHTISLYIDSQSPQFLFQLQQH